MDNGFQLQLEAGKGGEKMTNSLFSMDFFSGIKFYFHFVYMREQPGSSASNSEDSS